MAAGLQGTMGNCKMVRILGIIAILCVPAFAANEPLEDAIARMYDFNFPASHQILDGYISSHPSEPLPYAFRAAAYLFFEMDRMGILESEFLTDDDKISEKKKKMEPDPTTRTRFLAAIADTESRVS